jgi:hypothetical protein
MVDVGMYDFNMNRARDTLEGKVIIYRTCQEYIKKNNGKAQIASLLLTEFVCSNEELDLYNKIQSLSGNRPK